jgi:hypothetical protein
MKVFIFGDLTGMAQSNHLIPFPPCTYEYTLACPYYAHVMRPDFDFLRLWPTALLQDGQEKAKGDDKAKRPLLHLLSVSLCLSLSVSISPSLLTHTLLSSTHSSLFFFFLGCCEKRRSVPQNMGNGSSTKAPAGERIQIKKRHNNTNNDIVGLTW